jgi:hypothetical protein
MLEFRYFGIEYKLKGGKFLFVISRIDERTICKVGDM